VCAFANDLPGHAAAGVVFIGVRDDGVPVNLDISDRLLLTLADIKTDARIVPPPSMTVERRVLKGAAVAIITVEPSDAPPVRFDGRVWIRIGPRRGTATSQDERILNERRRHRDADFDTHPIHGCDIREINRTAFENEYLPQAVAADVLAANGRSYEERLASLGIISSVENPVPTVVGMLAFGRSPRTYVPCSYVQFLRIRGAEWGGPIADEQEIDGTLDQIIRRLDEKIRANLTISVDFSSGDSVEHRKSPYPISALQQITRNALIHRTYENTNAPVRVYWFDDRIEVHSPGGPYGLVTPENFGVPGVSDYRNPRIAAVLKDMGFVQRFGFGIAEARRSLAENGNPVVDFSVEHTVVLATLRAN